MLPRFIIKFRIILLILLILFSSFQASNVEIKISKNGVIKKNHCNSELMHSFNENINPKENKAANIADEELLRICPNNKYTCCTLEDMQPMLETFKYTRDLLLFKNLMLEKLLLYFNSVALESFENFTKDFNQEQIKCTGEREYRKLKEYYLYIQEFSVDVMEMVKRTTNQVIHLYSSFLCTACSPFNSTMYEYDNDNNRPIVHINKRTCQNIVEISLERKNLAFIWNRLNKIINAIKCKENTKNSKKLSFENYSEIELRYYSHESCLSEDQSFVDKEECNFLCKQELKFFSFDDFRLYRVKTAIEALQDTFEMHLKKSTMRVTDQLMKEEEEKHPKSEVRKYIDKLSCIKDRYYFLKQIPEAKYDISKVEVIVEKYAGLISNSYEINMLYFASVNRLVVLGFLLLGLLWNNL